MKVIAQFNFCYYTHTAPEGQEVIVVLIEHATFILDKQNYETGYVSKVIFNELLFCHALHFYMFALYDMARVHQRRDDAIANSDASTKSRFRFILHIINLA